MRSKFCLFGAAALLAAQAASAADLFRVTATVDSAITGSSAFTTAEQVFDSLTDEQLRALVPTYTGTSATTLAINYRGMSIDAAYAASDTGLSFRIDVLDISEYFEGATREESRQMLRDYLKRGDTLGRIMALLAAESPVDPVAGNPTSLQTRMVAGRYRRDFADVASAAAAEARGAGPTPTATAPRIASVDAGGLTSVTVGLPFSHAFGEGADRPWSVDGELQYARTRSAETYALQIGGAYRARAGDHWYLVPGAGLGVSASRDLAAVGTVAAVSLTSAYRLLDTADLALWMGNAVHWSRTLSTTISGYSSDPKLHNVTLTNGLQASFMPGAMLRDHWIELSLTDSRYRGSDLYDERYDEIGIALVQAPRLASGATTLRYELSYVDATRSRGWAARLHMSF